jgi:hypothetical protein
MVSLALMDRILHVDKEKMQVGRRAGVPRLDAVCACLSVLHHGPMADLGCRRFDTIESISFGHTGLVLTHILPPLQVRVQAGARVQAVADALQPHGITLQNYASIREQTVGGFTQVGRRVGGGGGEDGWLCVCMRAWLNACGCMAPPVVVGEG